MKNKGSDRRGFIEVLHQELQEGMDMFPYYLLLAAIFKPGAYQRYLKDKEAKATVGEKKEKDGGSM